MCKPKCIRNLIDLEHIFTPIAFERLGRYMNADRQALVVYIFGIRVAYFSLTKI